MSAQGFWALAWLHWRLTVNAFKSGKGRGELEGLSRLAAVILPVLLGILLIPATMLSAVAGTAAGYFLASRPTAAPVIVFLVGILLILPTVWAVIRPFGMAAKGHTERGELLRLLPLPTSLLRHVELLRAFVDPLFVIFAPGLLALAPGALLAGRPLVAVVAFAGGLGFLLLLGCLASLLSLASQLLLRDRRRGELAALIFMLVLSVVGFLPQVLGVGQHRPRSVQAPAPAERVAPPTRHGGPPELTEVPAALRGLPSFQLAAGLNAAASGQVGDALLPLTTLWAIAAMAYGLSAPLHRRLLDTPAGGGGRSSELIDVTGSRIPFVSGIVAAVAAVQMRAFLRTVRGKAAVAFAPFIGVLAAFMFSRGARPDVPGFFTSSYFAPAFVVLMTVANLGVLTCNQFATSGTGLILELLQPLGERAMVRGRALASATLCAATLLVATVPLLLFLPRASLPVSASIILAGLAVHVSLAPIMAVVSALFPKAADLSRLGQAGQPHPLAHLLGFLTEAIAMLPAAACIVVAVVALKMPWLAPLFAVGWLVVTCLWALWASALAERVVGARRENLALVAAGR